MKADDDGKFVFSSLTLLYLRFMFSNKLFVFVSRFACRVSFYEFTSQLFLYSPFVRFVFIHSRYAAQ